MSHVAVDLVHANARINQPWLALTIYLGHQWFAQLAEIILPDVKSAESKIARHHHLDPSALSTPSLAISCAAREAMYQAEVVETMLRGVLTVIKNDDLQLAEELRKMDDTVDTLYSSIKYYLTKIGKETMDNTEWMHSRKPLRQIHQIMKKRNGKLSRRSTFFIQQPFPDFELSMSASQTFPTQMEKEPAVN